MTSTTVNSVEIQPSAIFSIFDQFQRRSELCTGRLIGAIFGTRDEEGLMTVSQAFPIPHSEINDQVNINSEYYKNRAELIKTCYGRSQYILGWYSISLKDSLKQSSENFSITTSFIHDVFSKEIMKSSPVNVADSAVHLEILIEDGAEGCEIKYSALMASGKNGKVFNFSAISDCHVEYKMEETFVARSLLQSLRVDFTSKAVAFPSAKEINEASLKEFSDLLEKLKASPSAASIELLKHLPDAAAHSKQAEKIKSDLKGMHQMVKLLCDQLKESQKLYTISSE